MVISLHDAFWRAIVAGLLLGEFGIRQFDLGSMSDTGEIQEQMAHIVGKSMPFFDSEGLATKDLVSPQIPKHPRFRRTLRKSDE